MKYLVIGASKETTTFVHGQQLHEMDVKIAIYMRFEALHFARLFWKS